jgi:hypothetical protein
MTSSIRAALNGALAGAAGTTALNTVTYLDMAIRGRPTSNTPEDTVEKLADKLGLQIAGDDDTRSNRVQGLGPLTGALAGMGTGALLALLRNAGWRPNPLVDALAATAIVMTGTNGPMTALGITDPRTWPASSWITDIVPHLGYSLVTLAVLDRIEN